jgi:apolipoprotein N-acyltransferase
MTAPRHPINFSFGSLRESQPRDLIIRFAFGAAISGLAALVTIAVGPRFGGIFLAFPAILPATLTLIEKEEGERKTRDDDMGAILGAAALILFGWLAWSLIPRIGAPLALVIATVGWVAGALSLYVALRLTVEHRPFSDTRHRAARR